MKKLNLSLKVVLMLSVFIILAGCNTPPAAIGTQPPAAATPPVAATPSAPKKVTLPAGAQKVSDCIPAMGEHWANPANLPFGPFYLVADKNVVGIEYMISEDELRKNILTTGDEKEGKPVVMPNLGMAFDHIELNYEPNGHEGYTIPHYDLHMYLVPQEQEQKICPPPVK